MIELQCDVELMRRRLEKKDEIEFTEVVHTRMSEWEELKAMRAARKAEQE
jgi:hypothetical protein